MIVLLVQVFVVNNFLGEQRSSENRLGYYTVSMNGSSFQVRVGAAMYCAPLRVASVRTELIDTFPYVLLAKAPVKRRVAKRTEQLRSVALRLAQTSP